ncbi:hypothetical protein BDR06DRAFT_980285 [Suillus hirtellus]|nr:hypothetical protein BDR06DRAFT_980285 [Suillus hirtellus]
MLPLLSHATSMLCLLYHPLDIDVSSHQDTWGFKGVAFAYIRVTGGTIYINHDFSSKYAGTTDVGLICSGHHFARPDSSTGATQASYFDVAQIIQVAPTAIVSWIKILSYHAQVVCISTDWWKSCTGGFFAPTNPLWIVHPGPLIGTPPARWL